MKKILIFIALLCGGASLAQNPNDCTDAILICGNSSLGVNPSGVGFDEFSLPGNDVPPCYAFNNQTIWFRIVIEESGTFGFDLIPDVPLADFDFAVYGPDVTCTTLGAAIRCSSTNPAAAGVSGNTGMNATETDVIEGPGADGNGYLRWLNVTAGQEYYIIVDRAVGSGGFQFNPRGSATLPTGPTANDLPDIVRCDTDGTPDGLTLVDLDAMITTVEGGQSDVEVSFHLTLNDANLGIGDLSSPYMTITNPQTIYYRIEGTDTGCSDTNNFQFFLDNTLALNDIGPVFICSDEDTLLYDLNTLQGDIIGSPADYNFSYYLTQDDADTESSPIPSTIVLTTTPQTIYVRVSDAIDADCFGTTFFEISLRPSPVLNEPIVDYTFCDDDNDGFGNVRLGLHDFDILGDLSVANYSVNYYETTDDRAARENVLPSVYRNLTSPQRIYVEVIENISGCSTYTDFLLYIRPTPDDIYLETPQTYCLNADQPLELTVTSGYSYYNWNNGIEGPNENTIFVDSPGIYIVTVTNEFGCDAIGKANVVISNEATIESLEVDCFNAPNNTVTINATGEGDYVYYLDDPINRQDSNVFANVSPGIHTVCVEDLNGCGVICREIAVLEYPRFFTPNGDGYNDTWRIIGMERFPGAQVYIFDRYGKILHHINDSNEGWNGIYKGRPLPSSDYWFKVVIEGKPEVKGHFSMVRR